MSGVYMALEPTINAFCYSCKAPQPPDWTTGNKSLDSFIMESWRNVENKDDAYIQWIEYSLLTNVRKMTLLRHGCTHIAEWLDADELTRVTLKKIVDERNDQLFDFHQVNQFMYKSTSVINVSWFKLTSVVTTVFVYPNS